MSGLLPEGKKITAAHIRSGLSKYFPHPQCGIVFEVAQSTGFSADRHLDAVAMDTWPSRGLIVHGIEIKVSRHDYARELADPEKAEQIARFCDKFWIATPPGLLQPAELPHAWGLMEGGKDGMRIKKQAAKTKAQPITREFLAAIFRAAGRGLQADEAAMALAEQQAKLDETFKDRVAAEAARLSDNNTSDAQHWRMLMEALGVSEPGARHSVGQWDAKRYIATIKAVHAAGISESYAGLHGLKDAVDNFQTRLADAMRLLNAEVPDSARILAERIKPRGKR